MEKHNFSDWFTFFTTTLKFEPEEAQGLANNLDGTKFTPENELEVVNQEVKKKPALASLYIKNKRPETVPEVKIGKEAHIIPLSVVKNLLRWSDSVVWISTPLGDGTGFKIRDGLILTNYHLFDSVQEPNIEEAMKSAAKSSLYFKYDEPGTAQEVLPLKPEYLFVSNHKLDYCLVAYCCTCPTHKYSQLNRVASFQLGDVGQNVNIIHHPDGQPKSITASYNRITKVEDTEFYYTTHTEYGSSGSPLLNNLGQVIGLHIGHTPQGPHCINTGRRMTTIQEDLKPHLPMIQQYSTGVKKVLDSVFPMSEPRPII